MKKILIIIILAVGIYYFYNNSTESRSVSEIVNTKDNDKIIKVTGIVVNNFKLLYGVYELKDIKTEERIYVTTEGDIPSIGSTITRKLQKKI